MLNSNLIEELVMKNKEDIIYTRRYIHENPEMSGLEVNTSKFIRAKLDEWKISYKFPFVKNGLVSYVEGENPTKRIVAIRADMDALPIKENTGALYSSKNENMMHACGHDVHMTCVLYAAKIFSLIRNKFEGTVMFVFQPSEEKIPGGAIEMLKEGVFNNSKPNSIFAQHVDPDITVGKIGIKQGYCSAAVDKIILIVKGKGGHGAYPEKAVNPILIAAQILLNLNSVKIKSNNLEELTVLSFGKIKAGETNHIIPNECIAEGSLRTNSEKTRKQAHENIKKIASKVANGLGGDVEVIIEKGYPAVNNDDDVTKRARISAIDYLGEENVLQLEHKMGGEDFAYFLQEIPGMLYTLGTRGEKGDFNHPLHNDKFDVDEKSLLIGTGLLINLTLNELNFKPDNIIS